MARTKNKPTPDPGQRKLQPVARANNSARQKSMPALRVLPDPASSGERLSWRHRHADHGGPWCFHDSGGEGFCGLLEQLANLESMTVREVFNGGAIPGKDYEVEAYSMPKPSAA